MADAPVYLRRSRWDALVAHTAEQSGIPEKPDGGHMLVIFVSEPVEIDGILYLAGSYTLDERDTRS